MESQVKSPVSTKEVVLTDAVRYAELIAIARAVFYKAGNTKDQPGLQPNPPKDIYKQVVNAGDPSVDADFINDYDLLYNIAMTDGIASAGKVAGNQALVYYGFIAKYKQSPYNYVIAIRGTEANVEWASDMDDQPVPYTDAGVDVKVVKGFYDLYKSAQLLMPPDVQGNTPKQLSLKEAAKSPTLVMPDAGKVFTVVTGHSLGAALATLYTCGTVNTSSGNCGEVITYTFASPNVGNGLFALLYNLTVNENHRIYNAPDQVPNLPVNTVDKNDPYIQVAGGFEINSLDYPVVKHMENILDVGNFQSAVGCAHVLPTYLYVLEKMANIDANPAILSSEDCHCLASQKIVTAKGK